ncbi:CLUMA_CG004259, isoform B [Clunio marinus]|uniref:Hexosyltransferase n=1 Tax=Clunio marinus TaxID=568069 RepID=A0A1J1HT45_9DIPT|nr:CLUMA_CG004259, isoform B [Clunio marinus]
MTQRLKLFYGLLGAVIGLCIGTFLKNFSTMETLTPLEIINLTAEETPSNSQRTLVFVGVMTSKDFLESRAKAVYNTWGKLVPGRIAFFSSEGSSGDDLPVVALNGVDDRYPPQKKSFMMLHYMYEHFIDKFEWFLRADDDVFIKPDKLEKFLRRVDSTKAQFIGQAGRGNNEEFGLLSLEFDENFCMGGPGIIMSRQTLKRVAPHIPTCLKNLYSTHEDVEIGRCVQKFAGIPCTWNYEMQSIFHHNSSGNRAFSGNLKKKEVHSAITLHPIKRSPLMHRMYAYYLGLTAQELRQQSLYLHRDIAQMISLLQIPKTHKMLARGVPLFPDNDRDSFNFIDDHDILGNFPNLNRYMPDDLSDLKEWDFLAKSIYSASHLNPKRKMESSLREGLDDVIREIMENINTYSRQRGRVIEYRELLYGYSRVNSMHGHDLILDLLLVYKKYRGKKMTVPVRKHLYVQRSFTETRIREITNNDELPNKGLVQSNLAFNRFTDKMKSLFNDGFNDFYTAGKPRESNSNTFDDKIIFILPLSGRYEIFLRFLKNFEDVALRTNENAELLISLFINSTDHRISSVFQIIDHLNKKYQRHAVRTIKLYGEFSRGVAIDKAIQSSHIKDEDIIFLIDVDILFQTLTLKRIRQNTIRNQQIYLPIVFSEYNPELVNSHVGNIPYTTSSSSSLPSESRSFLSDYNKMSMNYEYYVNSSTLINNESGYFREFGYGIASIYKCDIMNSKINGFVTDIKGWGLEDVKFLEKILTASHQLQNQLLLSIADGVEINQNASSSNNLDVFRSPDPSLVHIYHPIVCDKNLEKNQYKMCLGTKSNTLGNFRLLKEKYFLKRDFMQLVNKVKEVVVN